MSEVPRISAAEARALVASEGWAYLDVRTPAEFEAGHPEGAFNVPWQLETANGRAGNPEFLAVVRAVFPKDTRLVVGCHSGVRSLHAARALVEGGYTRVQEQRAGWGGVRSAFGEVTEPGWQASGLPAGSGAPPGRAYADLVARARPA